MCHRECVSHIEEVIQMEGPHTIAAIMIEGITGSNGLLVPPDDYYPKLRALCDKYGILLIDDEVMAGFGRTGKWLATPLHYGIKPDIVTCAKGLDERVYAAWRGDRLETKLRTILKPTCFGAG